MKTTRIVIIFVLLSLALTLPVLAAAPPTLSYQGTLTDKAGNPITATRTIVFSLYNVATGGTETWTETQTLTVTGGRFGAVLGLTAPLDVSLLGGDTWLGIAVQGEPEMTPRQKLTSVAYAMKAQVAESVSSSDSLIPAGTVVAFAGTTAPAGWLLCNGAAVNRATYARLFAAISTTYGNGDGSTTFNVPDLIGRTPIGAGTATGITTRTIGTKVGSETHTLQGSEVPSHNHQETLRYSSGWDSSSPGTAYTNGGTPTAYGTPIYTGGMANISPGAAHNIMQPSLVINWIIKY